MTIENPGQSGNAPLSDVENQAKQDLSGAKETLRHDLDAISQRAAEDVSTLRDEAKGQIGAAAEKATEKAKSFANDQKALAATQITGVASAISKVADELEGEQATVARYARDLANGLEQFGRTVEGKSPEDLMGMAQQFGRSQPLAFLGAAALAGFVASRFAGASAQRQQASSNTTGYTGSSTGYSSGSGTGYAGSGSSYGSSTGGQPSSAGSSYSSASGNGTPYSTERKDYTGGQDVTG